MESGMDPLSRKSRCPQGFSALQITIISVLKGCPTVLAYWLIAQYVTGGYGQHTTEGAVRGAMERLFRRGFLLRSRAAAGHIKGNRYAFSSDPCPHIQPYSPRMDSGMESCTEPPAQSGESAAPSILREDQKERKNLSISSGEAKAQTALRLLEALTEEDMAFHWPTLARQGFATDQIRQILARLAQVNTGPEKVMQGLTHAEWELVAGRMRDKSGNSVSSPVSWVFKILATQGYYPRPEGYRSPQEQAEIDAAEEVKRLTAAYEARQTTEADAWIAGLIPDERQTILGSQNSVMRMPDEVFLRRHFRTEIWPKMRNGEAICR
jgi:hypothetical protein